MFDSKSFSKVKYSQQATTKQKKTKKKKNRKNRITTKIKIGAVSLLAKTVLLVIRLSKNSAASAKRVIDLHILSKDIILFLTEKKSG